jgi:chorismate mutase
MVDRVAVAELVARIRARQGLPPRIEDREVLRRVAALVWR